MPEFGSLGFKIMKGIIAIVTIVTVLAAHAEDAVKRPPQGYSLVQCDMIKTNLLKPDGWFVNSGSGWFAMTQSQMTKGKENGAALWVNVNTNCIPTNRVVEYVNQLAIGMTNNVIVWHGMTNVLTVLDRKASQNAAFVIFQCRSRSQGRVDTTVQGYWYVNKRTGTLTHVWFECRTADWDSLWKVGEPCLVGLCLNDQF